MSPICFSAEGRAAQRTPEQRSLRLGPRPLTTAQPRARHQQPHSQRQQPQWPGSRPWPRPATRKHATLGRQQPLPAAKSGQRTYADDDRGRSLNQLAGSKNRQPKIAAPGDQRQQARRQRTKSPGGDRAVLERIRTQGQQQQAARPPNRRPHTRPPSRGRIKPGGGMAGERQARAPRIQADVEPGAC